MKLQVLSTADPHLCWKRSVWGFDQALSGEEEDKEARNRPDVIAHLDLELSGGRAEVF